MLRSSGHRPYGRGFDHCHKSQWRSADFRIYAYAMQKAANTILVIEHEQQIRRFVAAGLELHGYSVCEADSGATGLSTATVVRPDLIILDPALADMNGAEVLKTIRSCSNVPVIILSVQSEDECKLRFLRSSADDYMTKPFGIAELAARCDAALRRYHKGVAGPVAHGRGSQDGG
jgi:two-component system KDP operon response regulator KdpE